MNITNLTTLLTPLDEGIVTTPNGIDKYVSFISTLEGAKTKIKNLHWSANAMNIHKQLDDLLSIVSDYQDSIAEESQGIYGQFAPNVISGTPCDCNDPIMMLEKLREKTSAFYSSLHDSVEIVGIRSETETFIHDLNKQLYLFRLCKG